VLICRQYSIGILNFDRYLREHHGTPIAQRREIRDFFSLHATVDLSAIKLLEQPVALILELRTPLDGIKCIVCSFITVSIGSIKLHCRNSHELS
jgi:hypothetical protein